MAEGTANRGGTSRSVISMIYYFDELMSHGHKQSNVFMDCSSPRVVISADGDELTNKHERTCRQISDRSSPLPRVLASSSLSLRTRLDVHSVCLCPVCLFSFVLVDPFHFQVRGGIVRPGETPRRRR